MLTDYFILRTRSIRPELLINWGAMAVWALGIALYYQFLKLGLVIGATIPVTVVTGLLYILVGGMVRSGYIAESYPIHRAIEV